MTGAQHVIEVMHLGRRFGSFTAVDDVSFHVERGEIFGFLGANGAGKSTTIRMLCGLLAPSSGDAVVAGHAIAKSPEAVKSSIGYMSQKFSLYLDLPVEDNLAFFGGAYGLTRKELSRRIEEVLEMTGLRDSRRTTTGQLSGGIRQRLALGSALLHRPPIVFLDEPTAGVDPAARREFWKLIRTLSSEGTTVFVTTHYMDEAEHCARIGLMVAGKLVALDTPAGLKRTWVPGRLLDVRGTGLRAAVPALRALPGVVAVEGFGQGLHVRLDPVRGDERAIRNVLGSSVAAELRIETIQPTLEDVFLVVAQTGAA